MLQQFVIYRLQHALFPPLTCRIFHVFYFKGSHYNIIVTFIRNIGKNNFIINTSIRKVFFFFVRMFLQKSIFRNLVQLLCKQFFHENLCHDLLLMQLMVYHSYQNSYAFSNSDCICLKQALATSPFLVSQALKEVGLSQEHQQGH